MAMKYNFITHHSDTLAKRCIKRNINIISVQIPLTQLGQGGGAAQRSLFPFDLSTFINHRLWDVRIIDHYKKPLRQKADHFIRPDGGLRLATRALILVPHCGHQRVITFNDHFILTRLHWDSLRIPDTIQDEPHWRLHTTSFALKNNPLGG